MGKASSQKDSPQWTWQFWTAVGIVIAFAALVVIMFMNAVGDETVWQRRVYLFGAVEAVVFTAVGWIFGREVHRSAVASAEQDAAAAKDDARTARDEAKDLALQASAAEQRAVKEETKGKAVQAVVHGLAAVSSAGGPSDVSLVRPSEGDAAVRQLQDFLNELYG